MPTYQQYQQQFVQDLINDSPSTREEVSVDAMSPGLQALIDAMPYYGDPNFQSAHRGALANLLEVYMPNNGVAAQPSDYGFGYSISYFYNGSASGYQNAFYNGIGLSSAASAVAANVVAVNGGMNNGWWGNYGVTVLTDAIRLNVGGALNTGKLSTDLNNNNSALLGALSASYLGVYQAGYTPTSTALNALIQAGQQSQANTELVTAISNGQFTANINQAIAMGGDSTNAAVWFLFNLWITLKALGNSNVDAAIQQFQNAGLTVPAQVGPGSWWTGGYISWYAQLTGSDVSGAASGTIHGTMPEKSQTYVSGSWYPATGYSNVNNGYCWSLINWGSLNWYNPPPDSCFGKGTGVLMADGTVKAIEEIQVGDLVQSENGSRRVVLVESPIRAKRDLHQVNDLNVFATKGHPFRTGGGHPAKRAAIDPWTLIDSIPTMTEDGVALLTTGSSLSGLSQGSIADISVEQIQVLTAGDDAEEKIYDLILERGETGASLYYVGGPDQFLAVDSETADPLYDPASTVAIVTAMQTAIDSCRKNLSDPVTQLPGVINQVQLGQVLPKAMASAWKQTETKLTRPSVPDLSFFTHEGQWDAHASMLETYLVRKYARTLRREAAMGWRSLSTPGGAGDRFAVNFYDIQLLGDVSMPTGTTLSVQLAVRGWGPDDIVQTLDVPLEEKAVWFLFVDQVVDFGRIPPNAGNATLMGSIHINGELLGTFHIPVDETSLGKTLEPFLFSPSGGVIGRVGLEPIKGAVQDRMLENARSETWSTQQSHAFAMQVGKQIGLQLVGLLES